ncbi:MAG: response regulator [Acidobacteriaceae bacterium]|nr:response regulator [Acidobacteriaceae bacterium]
MPINTSSVQSPDTVLMVEDNPADALMLRYALAAATSPLRLHIVGSGRAALAYLAKNPCPRGIILDRYLPGESGLEILERFEADPRLQGIPKIVVSGLLHPADELALAAQGVSYFVKPFSHEEWIQLASDIQSVCLRPPKQAAAVA